jgi:hypothetical protein
MHILLPLWFAPNHISLLRERHSCLRVNYEGICTPLCIGLNTKHIMFLDPARESTMRIYRLENTPPLLLYLTLVSLIRRQT